MIPEYLGAIVAPPQTYYVWTYSSDMGKLDFVHVGTSPDFGSASCALNRHECCKYFPADLWGKIETRHSEVVKMDEGEEI